MQQRKIAQKFSLIVSSLIVLVGAANIVGHLFHLNLLISPASMNPVTALCFILTGGWLLLFQGNSTAAKLSAPFISAFILVVGAFKLLQYFGRSNIEIDRWLFYDAGNPVDNFKEIAPNSALLLLFSGVVILNGQSRRAAMLFLNDFMKVTGFMVAYLAIMGYIYNLEVAYKVGTFAPLALNASLAYLAFFMVAIIVTPAGKFMRVIGSSYIGGRMARQAIPVILLIPLLFGYVRLLGERAYLYQSAYGTALESAFMVLMVLGFVYVYAGRLNVQEKKRNKAERQTAESEKKYKTLISALWEGVVYYDNSGLILLCNESFCKLTGFSEDEVKGRHLFDLNLQPENNEKQAKRLKDSTSGKSEIYEENLKRKDGNNIWVSISTSPVYNEGGEQIGALSTIVDITDKKKQIEDIEAFSASAAHDLNAPLARIEMIAMLLIDSTEQQLDDDNVSLLKAIAGITSNMRGLLRNLLQFSKIGASNIEKGRVDIMALAREQVDNHRDLYPAATVLIKQMPEVHADKVMLQQVFANLISNALKYSSRKEQAVVEIGSLKEGDRDVFYVKDNGAGFDMADSHKLFAAFQRLHIEFEGNGIGLPIVKRIVEKHGGKIWADSRPGEGATFYFTLS